MKKPDKKTLILIGITLALVLFCIISMKFTAKEHHITIMNYFDTVSEITVVSKTDRPLSDIEKYLKELTNEFSFEMADEDIAMQDGMTLM